MSVHPTAFVHPSAVIEEGAQIEEGAHIGPFCYIGPQVKCAQNVYCHSHVVIKGHTQIGADTAIHSFAVIGDMPQIVNYKHSDTSRLIIGARNTIREHVTINTGSQKNDGITCVGDDCMLMAGSHVAHDSQLMNRVVMVNSSGVAGHCVVEDDVIIGGLSGVHQYVRIGRGAIIGAITMVAKDVIPYALVQAPRGKLDGLNLVGLKRRGIARTDITALRAAFQMLAQGEGTFQDRAARLKDDTESDYVRHIVDFVSAPSERSFLTPE